VNFSEKAMTEHHDEAHSAAVLRAYLMVAVALSVFTLVSFVCNYFAQPRADGTPGPLPVFMSFVIILAVAVVKATLVGLVFMHVKWDWRNLYFMILPIFILAVMMMLVLMPDGVFGWKHDMHDFPQGFGLPAASAAPH
jgi:caa(3)-type oxidase subunit IV